MEVTACCILETPYTRREILPQIQNRNALGDQRLREILVGVSRALFGASGHGFVMRSPIVSYNPKADQHYRN